MDNKDDNKIKRNWLNFGKPYTNPNYHKHKYDPYYDEHSDYNTNAKSYYDYLARFNKLLSVMVDLINRLLRRDIKVKDTPSINFIKKGEWLEDDCDNFDDEIELSAHVVISKATEKITLKHTSKKEFTVNNATSVKNDGVFTPNLLDLVKALDDEIGVLNTIIKNQGDKITNLENSMKKIINNLYESGAITNNNINNFEFNKDRNIATGNINLFGGSVDGQSFIRTNKGKSENDITAGY